MSINSRTITKIKLDLLNPHARQAELFPLRSDAQLAELAADMDRRGLQHPIEILPDGTIIAGHERVRAARLLGWVEIDCIVRHDLAAQGDVAIEQHLIGDNLHNKPFSKLTVARCARRLKELFLSDKSNASFDDECAAERSMREKIGRILNLSGRHVDRLLLVAEAPIEVQRAYEAGQITMQQAGKPAIVHEELREKVVADIRAGVHPKVAIDRHIRIGRRSKKRNEPTKAYAAFLKATKAAHEGLDEHIDEVFPVDDDYEERVQLLESGIELVQRLVEHEHAVKQRQEANLAAAAERMGDTLAAIENGEMAETLSCEVAIADISADVSPDAHTSAKAKE